MNNLIYPAQSLWLFCRSTHCSQSQSLLLTLKDASNFVIESLFQLTNVVMLKQTSTNYSLFHPVPLPDHHILPSRLSHNHLRNSLPTKRLAIHERLAPHARQGIEDRRNKQHDGRGDQRRRRAGDERQPLPNGHDEVDGGARVISL